MKVFITGIAGFIGFHLARALKKRGTEVLGCDNFNHYYDPGLKRARAEILKQEGIQVLEADICDLPDVEITHMVHLAAQAGVRHSMKAPRDYVHSNLVGFVEVLEWCRRHPGVKLIYASSSSVYGLNEKIPFSETDPTDAPANLYAASKKSNELMAFSYHHLYKIPITGLRFFTVYGPWGRPDMAYFSFTKDILEGKSIQVFNEGKMKRDFTYIDDIVAGTIAAVDLGAECEIFNLGAGAPLDVMTLINEIEKRVGKKAQLEYLPMQQGEVETTYADIAKASKLLGYRPKFNLAYGIEQFVQWYLS